MKVTVIGATGRIGKRVVRGLVARGHEVTGVNRRANRVPVQLAGVAIRTVAADAADEPALRAAMQGADAVVLATAPTREDPAHLLAQTDCVIRAVQASAVGRAQRPPRLLVVSHFKVLQAPDGRPMMQADPPHPLFHEIEAVQVAQADRVRAAAGVDWLLVAPPAELYPYGEVTRRWRESVDVLVTTDPANPAYKETSALSMEDLAEFIVGELERPRHHRQLVTLAC